MHNLQFWAVSIKYLDFIYTSFLHVSARNKVLGVFWCNNNFEKLLQTQIFAHCTLLVKIHPNSQRGSHGGEFSPIYNMKVSLCNFYPLFMRCKFSSLKVWVNFTGRKLTCGEGFNRDYTQRKHVLFFGQRILSVYFLSPAGHREDFLFFQSK